MLSEGGNEGQQEGRFREGADRRCPGLSNVLFKQTWWFAFKDVTHNSHHSFGTWHFFLKVLESTCPLLQLG